MAESLIPEIRVIERGTTDWERAERRWIASYRDRGCRLCNGTDGGEGAPIGFTLSLEAVAKRVAANRGRVITVETRARMSAARQGRGPALTAASYEKMSKTKTGRPGPRPSPETIEKRTATIKQTWVLKKEQGWRPVPCSAAGRARTNAANTGRTVTSATRAKISAANKGRGLGRKLSPETRAKMSAGQLRRNARIRAGATHEA